MKIFRESVKDSEERVKGSVGKKINLLEGKVSEEVEAIEGKVTALEEKVDALGIQINQTNSDTASQLERILSLLQSMKEKDE